MGTYGSLSSSEIGVFKAHSWSGAQWIRRGKRQKTTS